MRKSIRRTCLLLVLCLVLGMLPMGALADGISDSVSFQSQYLVLDDHLVMHFTVAVPSNIAQNAQVHLTVADKTTSYTLSEMTADENGNYEVSVELAAAQMTETIYASVQANGETLTEKTYSVQAYAKKILSGNYTAEAKTLVKYLLTYGAKAQNYFHVNQNAPANDGISGLTQTALPTEVEPVSVTGSVSGLSYYGSSMLFNGKLAIRYYFAATNGIENITFAANEKNLAVHEKNGLYYVDADAIYPQNIDKSVTVTASTEEESLSVSYGPLNYMTRMYSQTGDDSLKALLQALYDYHLAAKAYTDGGELETTYPAVLPSYEESRADKELEVVAFWMPPIEEKQYQWLEEAGVTSLIIDNQYNTADGKNMRKALSLCDQYGISAYIAIGRDSANYEYASYSDMYTDHPSFAGFFVDEPITKTHVDNVIGVAKYAYENGYKLNLNLLWTYETSSFKGMYDSTTEYLKAVASGELFRSYDAYIDYAVEGLKPYGEAIQLATCNYSLMDTDASPSVANTWLVCLEHTRSQAQQIGAQMWQFVASSAYVDHRQPTEADLRWSYYAALAYGMTGIENFVWESIEPGGEFEEGDHGPIWYTDVNDTSTYYRSDVYYALQNVTNEIRKFDHVLLSFDWQGVMVNPMNSNTYTTAALKKATSVLTENRRIQSLESTRDLLVGCFRDANDYDGFLIVNFDETANNTAVNQVTVTFDKAATALAYVAGERQVVTLKNGTYSCELKPGEAVFVIPVEGDMEASVQELAIPENALAVEKFTNCGDVDGVAGVKVLTDGTYTDLIPADCDLNGYTHLTFRVKAQAGSAVSFGGQSLQIPDCGWTEVSVEISDLSDRQMVVTGKIFIDQIYATVVAKELSIPEGAVLVTDYSSGASPWNNPNYGDGANGGSKWYAQLDGRAGVQAFSVDQLSGFIYNEWSGVLPDDFDYASYTHLTFRLKVNKSIVRGMSLTDNTGSIDILPLIGEDNAWTEFTVKISDIPGMLLVVANHENTYGEAVWIDQVYASNKASELPIPEGAVLVTDFSTEPNLWVNPNYGSGSDGLAKWYAEYDGVAGVQAFGFNSKEDWSFAGWTGILPEFDFTGYTHITFRMKANKDVLRAVWLTDFVTNVDILNNIPESNEWVTVTLKISDLTGFYLALANTWGASGEMIWLDQVYVEKKTEEIALPEGAVLVTDFSTAATPWNNPNWGTGAVGMSNWYEEYDGVAGVQALGFQSNSDTLYTGWTAILPDFDYSDYTYITFRLKANKDVLRAVWLTDFVTDLDIINSIPASNEWVTVTLKIEDIPNTYMKLANTWGASGEMIWIDQVYVSKKNTVTICDYSSAITPHIPDNWGSGSSAGYYNSYDEYEGRSGVFGMGATSGNTFMWYNAIGMNDMNLSNAESITLRIMVRSGMRSLSIKHDDTEDIDILQDVTEFDKWIELTYPVADLGFSDLTKATIQLRFANPVEAEPGEWLWIDEVYYTEKPCTVLCDYSAKITPYIPSNWGSGPSAACYNSYTQYDGKYGVFSMGNTGADFMWYAGVGLENLDLSNAEYLVLRMKVKSGIRSLNLKHDGIEEYSLLPYITAYDEWITVSVPVSELSITNLSSVSLQFQYGTWDNGECEYVWLDEVAYC